MCIRDSLRASENDVEGVEMQSAPGNSSERSGLEAVSYTHLDVYKRQNIS